MDKYYFIFLTQGKKLILCILNILNTSTLSSRENLRYGYINFYKKYYNIYIALANLSIFFIGCYHLAYNFILGNGLTSEGSSQVSIKKENAEKKQHSDLMKEINNLNSTSNQRKRLSISDPTENGKPSSNFQEPTYSIVNKKSKNPAQMPANSESSADIKQNDKNTNSKTVPEAVITMPSNSQKQNDCHLPLGSASEENRNFQKNQNSNDEDEDENDREVRHIHANTTALNDEEILNNDSFMSKDLSSGPDEPILMTNPLVNNTYIRHSMDDPSVQQKNTDNLNPSKKHYNRKISKNGSGINDSYSESNDTVSNHPHYGIPELVEKTPQIPTNDNGFPSAFNAILSRTVKPDPNKTIEYGYHTQTNKSNESVSGKAAWYIESAPTKSGPIRTSAFFLQTSQPTQKNEPDYQNEHLHYPNNQSMTVNGNQFGPEHTSTPVNTYQPGGPVIKPKAKPRNRSTENSKDRFPLSIPQTEEGLSKAIPGQKSAVVKSGFDPRTGCQTTQVLWADSIPDPTDPDPEVDNPCITRKTINRITTRSTYGNLPENPFPCK